MHGKNKSKTKHTTTGTAQKYILRIVETETKSIALNTYICDC